MKNRTLGTIAVVLAQICLLTLAGGLASAADSAPLTPEYAAKKENFRNQHVQRVTHDQRKTAAEGLKAERLRVYQARQARDGKLPGTHPKPGKTDN